MRTSKKQLNNLVKIIADLTGMKNNKSDAIKAGKSTYLWLNEGFDNYYTLSEVQLPNQTQNMPFMLGHHAYKAGEMETMLRGLIGGLKWIKENELLKNI